MTTQEWLDKVRLFLLTVDPYKAKGAGMSALLNVLPVVTPLTWDEFRLNYPTHSIAIDGFVHAPPAFDPTRPCLNIDHHVGVDRLATRACCGQALLKIRQGLTECFTTELGYVARIYANDCDPDVALTSYFLLYPQQVIHPVNPLINRLSHMTDMLDSTGGLYGYPVDMVEMEERTWIFEPYWQFRMSGEIDRRDSQDHKAVVLACHQRIRQYLAGRGERKKLDSRYRQIGGGNGWAMIEEIGADARPAVIADGFKAFVSFRSRPDGKWTYTLSRQSEFISWFDLLNLYRKLNQQEGLEATLDRWGGSTVIGGSPRATGSRLSPAELEKFILQTVGR